jgi:hypothetical protein
MTRTRILTVFAAAAVLAAPATQAADRPRNPMDDLKSISDSTAFDAHQSMREEWRRDLVHHVYTPGDDAPWRDGSPAACAQPRNQYLMAFGEFMARHTQRLPTDRFAPPELRSIELMNRNLRADITHTAEHLPEAGQARFLDEGETLLDAPKSWDDAVRQRAEWTVVLDHVTHGLAAKAHGNLDFGANYAAGLWTRMACDFAAENAGFVRRYRASGAAEGSERTRAALELLESRK